MPKVAVNGSGENGGGKVAARCPAARLERLSDLLLSWQNTKFATSLASLRFENNRSTMLR